MNVSSVVKKIYNNEQWTTNNERWCKTNPIKANDKIGNMNVSIAIIKNYDKKQWTINNERYSKQTQTSLSSNVAVGDPIQTRSAAQIPMGELLGIFKPETNQTLSWAQSWVCRRAQSNGPISNARYLSSIFSLLPSVFCLLFSVLRPLFPDEAQILKFAPQK